MTAVAPEVSVVVPFVVPWQPGDDPNFLRDREWLVTNGLGGYASGTIAGGVARKHHGIFIPNLPSPHGRTMLVPFLGETAVTGRGRWTLGEIRHSGARIEGNAAECIRSFRLEGQTPVWEYQIDDRRLERRIAMPHGQNTICVTYTLLEGDPLRLHLRPYLTFRSHHDIGVTLNDPTLLLSASRLEVLLGENIPPLRISVRPSGVPFLVSSQRVDDVYLQVEAERGYQHIDTWESPGQFEMEIAPGESRSLLASTEPWPALEIDPAALHEAERRRCERLLLSAAEPLQQPPAAQLVIAADQFLVFPGSRLEEAVLAHAEGTEPRTVIAGYPWFTDWGRDSMISLEGLTLVTGRAREARWILRTFAHYVKNGLIPNNFPEGQQTAVYHTVDATLWYFHALDRYLTITGDQQLLIMLFPILKSIIDHHFAGTDFGIRVDPADGLLQSGAEGYQLTWMDAKVDGWVVTPRRGKPVEIQALWYNALSLMASWSEVAGQAGNWYAAAAQRAQQSFNQRFWIERTGSLYDVIDGPTRDDDSFRPNQVISLSLRHPVLDSDRWKSVVDAVADRLLTPFGLRTLERAHRDYKPAYMGDLRARDAAYHQGTVWPWLIGPFADAWERVHGPPDPSLLRGLLAHLTDAAIGTISEIFDAEKPFTPRGSFAQAWSVAEVLRVLAKAEPAASR